MFSNLLTNLRQYCHRSHRMRRRSRSNHQWQIQPLEPRLLLSTIDGRVWLDSNINGIQDARINGFESDFEAGLAGITVLLLDNNKAQIDSTTTDADGLFQFTVDQTGSYYLQYDTAITLSDVSNQLTFQNQLYGGVNLPTMDSDANTLTGVSNVIIIGSVADAIDDQGAGYAPIFNLASLSSVVVGQQYDFAANLSLPDYMTGYAATIEFGDTDHTLTLTEQSTSNTMGDLKVTIDFDTYDSNDFFDTQFKRDLMQYAASTIANRFGDTLSAITPGGSNTYSQVFFAPDTDIQTSVVDDPLATNELQLYVGSFASAISTLGVGGPGGYSVSGTAAFNQIVIARGQSGIYSLPDAQQTDFALWGGTVTFNSTPRSGGDPLGWYFGLDTPDPFNDESDFLAVAMHEMMHVFGFGTASTWDNQRSGLFFTGIEATADYGSNPPVDAASLAHFAEGTIQPDTGEEAAMDPTLTTGTRKIPTSLDYAVMNDLGWDLLEEPTVSTDGHADSSFTFDTIGTQTVTLTIVTATGNLTYQVNINVIDAVQVISAIVNDAGYDTDDALLVNPNFSQSIQRSLLQSIVVTFNREVVDMTTSDIDIKFYDQIGNADLLVLNDAIITTTDHITFTIDLRNMAMTDGVYELLIHDTVVDAISQSNLDGDADNIAGGTYTSLAFHQLGGDFNGDTVFNIRDLSAVAHYWNGNTANPPSYIDVTGDDNVHADDLVDFAQWMSRLDLTVVDLVVEQAALFVAPSQPAPNLAMALAAYHNKQASLNVMSIDDTPGTPGTPGGTGDTVAYEDLIGQWLM